MGNKAEQGDFENSQHKVSLNKSGNNKFVDIPSERSASINDEGIIFRALNRREEEEICETCKEAKSLHPYRNIYFRTDSKGNIITKTCLKFQSCSQKIEVAECNKKCPLCCNDEGDLPIEFYEERARQEGYSNARKEIYNFALKQMDLVKINLDREINVEFNQGMKYVYEFLLKMLEKKNERN